MLYRSLVPRLTEGYFLVTDKKVKSFRTWKFTSLCISHGSRCLAYAARTDGTCLRCGLWQEKVFPNTRFCGWCSMVEDPKYESESCHCFQNRILLYKQAANIIAQEPKKISIPILEVFSFFLAMTSAWLSSMSYSRCGVHLSGATPTFSSLCRPMPAPD